VGTCPDLMALSESAIRPAVGAVLHLAESRLGTQSDRRKPAQWTTRPAVLPRSPAAMLKQR
jgi:hypothetical protein